MSQSQHIRSGIGLWEGTDDVCRRCGRPDPVGAYCAQCIPIVRQALSDGIWWLCLMQCVISGGLLVALFVALGEPADAAGGRPAAFFWPSVYLDPIAKGFAMILLTVFAAADVVALATAVFMDLPTMLTGRGHRPGRARLQDIDLALRTAPDVVRASRMRSRQEKLQRLIEDAKLEEKYVGSPEGNRKPKVGYDPFSTGWSLWLTIRAVGIGCLLAAQGLARAGRWLTRRSLRALRWLIPRTALLLHVIEWILGALQAGVHALRCRLGRKSEHGSGGVRLSAAHHHRSSVFDSQPELTETEWNGDGDGDLTPEESGGLLARCPSCGRQRRVDQEGAYRCSACGLEFSVNRDGCMIRTSCPVCGRAKPAPRLGRYRCKSCKTVFHLTRDGCRIEAECPGCGKTRPVDHPGKYRCSQCSQVFEVQGGPSPAAEGSPRDRSHIDRPEGLPPVANSNPMAEV